VSTFHKKSWTSSWSSHYSAQMLWQKVFVVTMTFLPSRRKSVGYRQKLLIERNLALKSWILYPNKKKFCKWKLNSRKSWTSCSAQNFLLKCFEKNKFLVKLSSFGKKISTLSPKNFYQAEPCLEKVNSYPNKKKSCKRKIHYLIQIRQIIWTL
jgi:hypothetical protein